MTESPITIEEITKLLAGITQGDDYPMFTYEGHRISALEDNDLEIAKAAPRIAAKAIELADLARALFCCIKDNQLHDPKVNAAVDLYNHIMGKK